MTNLIIELYKYQAESERSGSLNGSNKGLPLKQQGKYHGRNLNMPKMIPVYYMLKLYQAGRDVDVVRTIKRTTLSDTERN